MENKSDIRFDGKDYKPIYIFILDGGYVSYIVEDYEGVRHLLRNDKGVSYLADKDALDSMISSYKTYINKMEEAAKYLSNDTR